MARRKGCGGAICKWDLVYRDEDASFVDVSLEMIEPFHPSEKTLEVVADLLERNPVPIEELERLGDH